MSWGNTPPGWGSAGRRPRAVIAIVGVLMGGCSGGDGTAPAEEEAAAASDISDGASGDASGDGVSGDGDEVVDEPSDTTAATPIDLCNVVNTDDLATVLAAAASATYRDDVMVGDPTPLTAGECSFSIDVVGVGSDYVQVSAGDDFTFGHYRDTEETTDVEGLGDDAYRFHGVAGPELHVRHGRTWVGVRVGGYDDRFGLTEQSHVEMATVVLDHLAG